MLLVWLLVCSLFYTLAYGYCSSVKLGLLFTFGIVSLHSILALCKLFVLYVSLAIAAVNVRLRYFF